MIPFSPGTPGDGPYQGRPDRADAVITDDRIRWRAAVCLVAVLSARAYAITVRVQNGVVILDGSVPSEELRIFAHRVAWCVPAVRDVCNRLSVDSVG